MEFGTAIPLHLRQQYAEGSKLAPARDQRNNSFLWKKARVNQQQQVATVQMLQKVSREVAKMRRTPLGGYVPTKTEQMFPFRIYQIENASATTAQKKIFTDAGVNIDDYTVQIRSGITSARPFYNAFDTRYLFDGAGNFEQFLYCENTDSPPQDVFATGEYPEEYFFYPPTPNSGTCTIIDDTADTLIDGIPFGFTPGTQWLRSNQICLNPKMAVGNFDQFQNCSASFWLEVIDDPVNGFWVNLMARMFSVDVGSTRNLSPFPTGANIIPVGSYQVLANYKSPTGNYLPLVRGPVTQYLTSHCVNRWPPASSTFLGKWTELFAALPVGKTNLSFYPGDIVIDDTNVGYFSPGAILTSGTFYGVYKMTNAQPIFQNVGADPHTDSANWTQISCDPAPYTPP